MASPYAPPGLFRVTTLAAAGEEWIPDGFHLRCWPSPIIGFPLHPFVALPVKRSFEAVPVEVAWTDARGAPLTPPFDLGAAAGKMAEGRVMDSGGQTRVWSWLRLDATPGPDFRADALSPGVPRRVVATRRAPPFSFGDEPLALRVSGEGVVQGVVGVDISAVARGVTKPEGATLFGLPFDGDVAWYARGQGVPIALDRVARAAPSKLAPPDAPASPAVPVSASDEVSRVIALAASAKDFLSAFLDPAVPPVDAVFSHPDTSPTGQPMRSSANVTDALLLAGADPGLARYLGLAATLEDKFDLSLGPLVRLVAAVWLIRPNRLVPGGIPLGKIFSMVPYDGSLADGLLPALLDLFPATRAISAPLVAQGWELRCLVAVAAAGAPPDPPDPASLHIGEAHWNPARPGTWTQALTLGPTPPSGVLALARLAPPPIVSLHSVVPVAGAPGGQRAMPLVAGLDQSGRPQVVDRSAETTGGDPKWGVWVADAFGRWSPQATVTAPAPGRPAVPPADLVVGVVRVGTPPPGTAPVSPGTLTIRITKPPAAGIAPGGFSIVTAIVSVDGTAMTLSFPPGSDTVQADEPIVALPVGGSVSIEVTAILVDSAGGTSSIKATERRDVLDARRPPSLITSPTLLWAGRRDNAGLSEIALEWDATPPAMAWRVYLSDEVRLANALGVSFLATMTRAERAAIVMADQARLGDRSLFSLVTREALMADAGRVRFRHLVSGSLRTVQFVRVVPLTAGRVEADFATCGLVPVAIPLDDRPPAPRLTVRPAGGQAATPGRFVVTVRATALRADLLQLLGALGSADPPLPPLARVRRRPAPMADPAHAPVVATFELAAVAGEIGTFEATMEDGLSEVFPPFAQIAWSAEVAYPAETDHTPGTVALPIGDVRPTDAGLLGPLASEWGRPSLIVQSAVVPAAPQSPTATASRASDGRVTITATGLPVAGRTAPGPYILEVWGVTGGAPVIIDPPLPVTAPTAEIADPVAADSYLLVLVDPIGRRSDPTAITPVP